MYEILLSDEAKKQLINLPSPIKEKISSAFERIKIRPHKFVKRLYNSKYYRLRVDDYRVILDIQDNKLIILIVQIGHRKNIYKN